IHPVLTFEFGNDSLNRALHAKRLAAANALGRLLLLDDAAHGGGRAEIDLRLQADHFLGTGCFAKPALYAGVLGKAEHRAFGVIGKRTGRTRHTHERQSVQPSTLTSTAPNGAPSGSGTTSTGEGATACSSRRASRITSRLRPVAEKVAVLAGLPIGAIMRNFSPSVSGSSVSIVATRAPLKPRPFRIGSASATV